MKQRIAEIREDLRRRHQNAYLYGNPVTLPKKMAVEMVALLTRLEQAEQAFSLPLSEDEAKEARKTHSYATINCDPYALEKAIESVLQGRKAKWLEGEG